jgi:hypothetical protein
MTNGLLGLQKETIKLSPFRKGYIVVLWIVGGTRWRKYYYYGPRKLNVILAQLRCTASFRNQDLYKVHILSSIGYRESTERNY